MLINKEMYNLLIKISDFTDKHGTVRIDAKILGDFIKENRRVFNQLKQAGLIHEGDHSLTIIGPGYMAIEAYKSKVNDRSMQLLFLIIAIASLTTAVMSIIN